MGKKPWEFIQKYFNQIQCSFISFLNGWKQNLVFCWNTFVCWIWYRFHFVLFHFIIVYCLLNCNDTLASVILLVLLISSLSSLFRMWMNTILNKKTIRKQIVDAMSLSSIYYYMLIFCTLCSFESDRGTGRLVVVSTVESVTLLLLQWMVAFSLVEWLIFNRQFCLQFLIWLCAVWGPA